MIPAWRSGGDGARGTTPQRIAAQAQVRPGPAAPEAAVRIRAAPAKRTRYSLHLHLTAQRRRELKQRAEAEGRLVANFVTAMVVSRLRKAVETGVDQR